MLMDKRHFAMIKILWYYYSAFTGLLVPILYRQKPGKTQQVSMLIHCATRILYTSAFFFHEIVIRVAYHVFILSTILMKLSYFVSASFYMVVFKNLWKSSEITLDTFTDWEILPFPVSSITSFLFFKWGL